MPPPPSADHSSEKSPSRRSWEVIRLATAKHCQFDRASARLVKRLLPSLALTFENVVNASFNVSSFPCIPKDAIVRLKKPTDSPQTISTDIESTLRVEDRCGGDAVARINEHVPIDNTYCPTDSLCLESIILRRRHFIVMRAINSGVEVCVRAPVLLVLFLLLWY